MIKEIQWRHGFTRLWVAVTLLWIAVSIYFVVIPHYFTEAPVEPPNVDDIQKNVQNQLECLGYVDEKNTDKPWLHWKCASKPVGQDSRLDINIQNDNDDTLRIILSDGEQIVHVPKKVSAKEISDKLYRHFIDKASKVFREQMRHDAWVVFTPPLIALCFGLVAAWVMRGFVKP